MFYFAWRRGLGMRLVQPPPSPPSVRTGAIPVEPQCGIGATNAPAEYRFEFMHQSLGMPRDALDWRPAGVTRLWRYNLHYFDYLADTKRSLGEKCALLDDWIQNNPQGSEVAWEPYTASLRIVNWCKFLAALAPGDATGVRCLSLYTQALWLEKNLELHILANHYFENIKALIFAGTFFDDANSARWLRRGQQRLHTQLREQTLADGGHYERSPQYHCIMLDGYLDLYALARANPALFQANITAALEQAIRGGISLLQAIATPDSDIPLFNDSAHNAATPVATLLKRAAELEFFIPVPPDGIVNCPATGLFGWKNALDYFLIDCGDIGPSYQPGHTHCDFLSYVLMLNGKWLVVDTGVYQYEPGAMRSYVRSTAAHNTVVVDDQEQSEVWGEFRVGHRARRLAAEIRPISDGCLFDGAYRGFAGIAGGVVHRRRATLRASLAKGIETLEIFDEVSGRGYHTVKSILHLHPSVSARIEHDTVLLYRNEVLVAKLTTDDTCSIAMEESWYCPEFGVKLGNTALRLELQGTLPLQLNYRITRVAP
jgi:uncharacterized heparinase superfamily protein